MLGVLVVFAVVIVVVVVVGVVVAFYSRTPVCVFQKERNKKVPIIPQ